MIFSLSQHKYCLATRYCCPSCSTFISYSDHQIHEIFFFLVTGKCDSFIVIQIFLLFHFFSSLNLVLVMILVVSAGNYCPLVTSISVSKSFCAFLLLFCSYFFYFQYLYCYLVISLFLARRDIYFLMVFMSK